MVVFLEGWCGGMMSILGSWVEGRGVEGLGQDLGGVELDGRVGFFFFFVDVLQREWGFD